MPKLLAAQKFVPPPYFLHLKSKTNISAANCFQTIFIHKISSVFLWKKS